MSDSYYDSEEWQEERAAVLSTWKGLCEYCGEPTHSPHVHHTRGLNYEEYEVLCPECHADHHGDDEIAEYQGSQPKCKECGVYCYWKQIGERYRLVDHKGNQHICKAKKEEAKQISNSIMNKMVKIQKPLF